MKYLTHTLIGAALVITGMFAWYLLATEVNRHADIAATVIIEDTLISNAAYDIEALRKIEAALSQGDSEVASTLLSKLIENKTSQLKACVTNQCEVLGKNRVEK